MSETDWMKSKHRKAICFPASAAARACFVESLFDMINSTFCIIKLETYFAPFSYMPLHVKSNESDNMEQKTYLKWLDWLLMTKVCCSSLRSIDGAITKDRLIAALLIMVKSSFSLSPIRLTLRWTSSLDNPTRWKCDSISVWQHESKETWACHRNEKQLKEFLAPSIVSSAVLD